MKAIFIKAMLISLALFVKTNLVFSQDQKENSIGLTGEMELNIDLSNMRDTSGRFMLMVGGEMFYPQIEKATITLRVFMKEPRRVFFGFYPNEQFEKNKGKELNDIAALTGNFIEFLGIPGQYKVVVPNSVAEAKIVNPIDHQKNMES